MLEESEYEKLAREAFKRIEDLFEDVDPDDADMEPVGDVIRITFRTGGVVVINTQRPARQIWLAGAQRAWHFSYEDDRWLDDKGSGDDLFGTLRALTRDAIGLELG